MHNTNQLWSYTVMSFRYGIRLEELIVDSCFDSFVPI